MPDSSDPRSSEQSANRPCRLLVSAESACKLIDVSISTWRRLDAGGRVPAPIRLSRGCVRWRSTDLDEWIKMGCPSRTEFESRQRDM